MSLKALAENVLRGTSYGTKGGTDQQFLSQIPQAVGQLVGTDEYEERAAIMQFDGGISRPEAEAMARKLMEHGNE